MIQTEGITKSFGALQVLKGIDLTINKGEVVAIIGPSGAGKTTLLQIIGTLDAPDSGRLVINGTETRRLGDKELAAFRNRNIGFVFQFHQLLPEFTALENVMIPALIAKEKSAAAEKRAKEILDFLKLSDRTQACRVIRRRETAGSGSPCAYQQSGGYLSRRTFRKSRYQEQGRIARPLLRVKRPDEPDIRHRDA